MRRIMLQKSTFPGSRVLMLLERGIVHVDLVREVCTIHRERQLPRMLSEATFSLEDSVQLAAGTVANTAKVALG